MYKMSIAIPTSGMKNKEFFFTRCLESLWNQSFQDFEIIVTDNAPDNEIKTICDWYKTGIRYYRNPNTSMAQNTNAAIKKSEGELIKILFMDDFMAHDDALMNITNHFKGEWLVTGCSHTEGAIKNSVRFGVHFPEYNEQIHLTNTIGSPSVLTVRKNTALYFDENLTWLLDADLYRRYYDKYGLPTILKDVNVVIGIGSHQATNTMGETRKLQEEE